LTFLIVNSIVWQYNKNCSERETREKSLLRSQESKREEREKMITPCDLLQEERATGKPKELYDDSRSSFVVIPNILRPDIDRRTTVGETS
jgi:hypothetical protein